MNNAIYRQLAELQKAVKTKHDAQDVIDRIDITERIAPKYWELHNDIQEGKHQYYNLPGGRGSGKSSFCALEIVNGIMKDATGQSSAIIFRRTANTMRESVFSQIAWAIDVLDVNSLWRSSVSPMYWTYKPTGAQILFRGLDDSSKLKSIKPRHGYFKYIWLEEFSELPGENFTRSVMQSVLRGGENFVTFRSFNPPISASNWANVFIQRPDDRAITLHTTYLDIPAEWLGPDFIYEAERLQEINEKAYRHEYLGEATGSGGEVFPNITVREITDDEINELQYIYQGLDFGFSVDPTAFIRVGYDSKTETIFFLDEIVKTHLSNKELAAMIKERGYDIKPEPYYMFGQYYLADHQKQLIIADSADPRSISDLQGEGLKVIPCKKYAGSVNYGIKWLQHRNIVIDPKRTPKAHTEFISYEYMTTKDGEFLADVPDKNNHTIDGCRYALSQIIDNKKLPA